MYLFQIAKYNEKYKSMNLLCFGVLDKDIQVTGPTEVRTNFALKTEVQTAYKEAVLNHSYGETEEGTSEDCSYKECLDKHVFDLNVDMMRSILSTVAGPSNSLSNKSGRRNWYQDRNCPAWWRRTGIAFQSVNQRDGKKLGTNSLMKLIESLQQQYGIVPGCPKCANKTGYISVFVLLKVLMMKEDINQLLAEMVLMNHIYIPHGQQKVC
ncbi:uncharacterized protein LOC132722716 isoform X2 [Ruditapes philippinarum]|uniref:uncharacterized protein LOC132722716 isoform X2 n=1 Tax=Ruditapes philippinarum TaxID=129788 RepID=UPI00295B093E|nr:uncharacterized protein LOC132722716 isoform X2 [Ruditapes philippinarum]